MTSGTNAIRSALGRYGIFERKGRTGALLIHGITGAPTEMKHPARQLAARGFTVACPQLAGHCSSLKELKTTHWTDWYKSAARALDFLRGECDTVVVGGLSAGALLALLLAAERPDAVQGLAVLSVTFFYDGWNMPKFKRRWLLPLVLHSPLRYFLSYREPSPYGIKDEKVRRLVGLLYNNDANTMPEKYGYSEFPAVTIRETGRLIGAAKRALPKVRVPTLAVHSAEDDMASTANVDYLRRHLGTTAIEVHYLDDTYHVLTLDRRKNDVAMLLAEFIARHVPSVALQASAGGLT